MMKNRKNLFILIGSICSLILLIGTIYNYDKKDDFKELETSLYAFATPSSNNDFLYLSDLEFDSASKTAYGSLLKDITSSGTKISVKVEGSYFTFDKGIWAHATSTVIYDISNYDYNYFTAFAGLNATAASSSNGVLFSVYTSVDGTNWDTKVENVLKKAGEEAEIFQIDIKGANYLKLVAGDNGSNGNDHAVYADAKLTNTLYDDSIIKPVSYYDDILKKYDAEYNYNNNYRYVLEREVVNKLGYWTIQTIASTTDITGILEWIYSDNRILEEVIEVGELSNISTFLKVLNDLYNTYKTSLNTTDGLVYEKMMIGLAAAYSTDRTSSPLTFSHYTPSYDYVERFGIFKELYDNGLFLYGPGFKDYHVELFRMMLQDGSRNDEIAWLNYMGASRNYATGTYSYVAYISPNYSKSAKPHLYDPANKELYDAKYKLSDYGVPFADDITRYWMVMQEGGICWNQARFVQAIAKTMGRPSIGTYQPMHETALIYTTTNKDGTGNGYWDMAGNIFGWGSTATAWYGGNVTRTLFNWGRKSFTDYIINGSHTGYNAAYIYLAQENLNRYADYKKSLYLNLIANSYDDNATKLSIYNKALAIDEINLDSYDYKVQMYKALEKTSDEWYALALDIIDNYTYYPMAMYDLLNVIKPYLNGVHRIDIDQKEYDALVIGTKTTANDNWQYGIITSVANALLKKSNADLASFSFDGEKAGQIVISSDYDLYTDLQWHYSLDGGKTKSAGTTEHSFQLSASEIAKINAEDDIRIYIDGLPGDALAYTIDIVEGTLPTTLYGNDLENRVVGVDLTFEWRNSENDAWTSYATASPDNSGNKTLYVRVGATGNKLPSESTSFTFTPDNQPDTRKYVAVSHLTIDSYSTQSVDTARPYYAPNAIDGNINTLWHTDFRYNVLDSDTKPFITIKLDKARYISAIEFIQTKYRAVDPDYIKNATIFISEDGESWIEAGKIEDCPQDNELRTIDFDKIVYGSYIKIELDTYDMFASLAMVNVFQDLSQEESDDSRPTGGVAYSTTSPTQDDVVARLVNVSVPNYTITSAGGDTHVFTENGTFTFTFQDTDTGRVGTSVAKVDWIDRKAPTATIEYNITTTTNESVIATLVPDEFVNVTNNGNFSVDEGNLIDADGNIIKENVDVDESGNVTDEEGNYITNINTYQYIFHTNGEFTFEFEDLAGNKGTATATVDWIDPDATHAEINYDITDLTNNDVTATITFNKDNITIINNGGSNSYVFTKNGTFTFTYQDEVGHIGTLTAIVNWIDKVAPTATLVYDKTSKTEGKVSVVNPSEEIAFEVGDGTYTFDRNGVYAIVFYDKAGNRGVLKAIINWLEDPTDNNNSNNNNNNSNNNNSNNNNNTTNNGSNNNTNNGSNNNTNNNVNNPVGDNSNNTNNNNTGDNNNNLDNDIDNTINNDEVRTFTYGSITVKGLTKELNEVSKIKVNNLTLTNTLKNKVGSESELIELYFVDDNGGKVNIETELTITMSLNTNKEFKAIYLLENGILKELSYTKLANNKIEFKTSKLGQIVIEYKEPEEINPNVDEEVKNNNLVWYIASGIVLLSGILVIITKRDK